MERQVLWKCLLLIALLVTLILCALGCGVTYDPMERASLFWQPTADKQKIPVSKEYKSYTLFLAPGYHYEKVLTEQNVEALREDFFNFSKLIGDNNLAVWLSKPDSNMPDPQRSAGYLDIANKYLGTDYRYPDGPFIVYFSFYPDKMPQSYEAIVGILPLRGIYPDEIAYLFDSIAQLVRTGEIDHGKMNFEATAIVMNRHILAMKNTKYEDIKWVIEKGLELLKIFRKTGKLK
jgi:hypothetical protein